MMIVHNTKKKCLLEIDCHNPLTEFLLEAEQEFLFSSFFIINIFKICEDSLVENL